MNLGGVIHLNKSGICLVLTVFALFFFYLFSKSAKTSVTKEELKKPIDLNKLLEISIKAAQNGGKEILNAKDHLQISTKGKTLEGVNDPVTSADYNSHCAMKATLKHQYPNLLVVSEETNAKCDSKLVVDYTAPKNFKFDITETQLIDVGDLTVWIDPLDATKEFTEKLYQYVTTMVCVAVKGEPLIGIVHQPFEDKTYWAWVGKAVRNLQLDLNKSSSTNLKNRKPKVIVSMSHSGTINETLQKSFNHNIEVITAAGAGYKVLEVVAGKADAYVHSTAIKKWDICAGNAILNSVGGRMTTKHNATISYEDFELPVNTDGIIATVREHDRFIGMF